MNYRVLATLIKQVIVRPEDHMCVYFFYAKGPLESFLGRNRWTSFCALLCSSVSLLLFSDNNGAC